MFSYFLCSRETHEIRLRVDYLISLFEKDVINYLIISSLKRKFKLHLIT